MTSSLSDGQTSFLSQMTQRTALSDSQFRRICQLIYQRAGIVLADHKRDMVYNRLVRRLRVLGIADFGHYLSLLEADQNSPEWQAFINSLTTNLTAFFREGTISRCSPNTHVVAVVNIVSGVRRRRPEKNRTVLRSRLLIRWASYRGAGEFCQ